MHREDHVGYTLPDLLDRRQHAPAAPRRVEDAVYDPRHRPAPERPEEGVARSLHAGDGDFDWTRLTKYLGRFGSGAVVKRLGFLVEALELTHPPTSGVLDRRLELLTAGVSKLDPSTPREPRRIVTRWRVEVNLPEKGLLSPARSGTEK